MAQGSEGTEAGEKGTSETDFPSLSPFRGVGVGVVVVVEVVCAPGIVMSYT